jgi:hypothetical protein
MKMRKTLSAKFIVTGCLFVLLACKTSAPNSQTTNLPAWVSNPGSSYSENQYLMAVGSGSTMNDARSRAMQNLAQIFRTQIDGSQELFSEFVETSRNNEGFSSTETMRLMNNVRLGASEELLNTEVLESHIDRTGTVYVLAGMNRMESARLYQQELTINTQKIQNYQLQGSQQSSVIRKLGELRQALLLARVNENLSRQLAIIQPGSSNREQATQVVLDTENAFRDVQGIANVQIRIDETFGTIRDGVAKVFQQQGFSISTNKNPELLATVEYKQRETNLKRDDAVFVAWELSIQLSEVNTNQTYTTFTALGREGALTLSDAYKRAEFSAAKEIETKFKRFLTVELTVQD